MKSAMWKDNFREIKDSFARFFSLLIIIMLGVSFFVGIKAAGPSMLKTADVYYRDNHLPDGQIIGTLGLTREDLNLVQSIEDVDAQGLQSVIQTLKPSTENAKFLTFDGKVDHDIYQIVKGRMLENPKEIVLDSKFIEDEQLQEIFDIGDTVTVDQLSDYSAQTNYPEGQTPLHFTQQEFEIVGFAQTPIYMDRYDRGIQGNSVFAVVHEEAIAGDYFSEILFWTPASEKYPAYTQAYDDAVGHYIEAIEQQLANQPAKRLEDIQEAVAHQLSQSQWELDNVDRLIDEQQNMLTNGRNTLDEAWNQYDESLDQIQESYQSLLAGQVDYEAGVESFQQGQQTLDLSKAMIEAEEENFQEGWSRYLSGERAYQQQINQAYDQLIAGQEQIEQGEQALNDTWQQLTEGQRTIDRAKNQLPNINTQGISSIQTLLDYIQEDQPNTDVNPLLAQANQLHQEYLRLQTQENDIVDEKESLMQEQQSLEQAFNELLHFYESLATSFGMTIETSNLTPNQIIERYREVLDPYLQSFDATMQELETQIASLDSQMNTIQQEIAELEIEREQIEQTVMNDAERKNELYSTEAELDHVNQQLIELEQENNHYQNQIATLNNQIENLTKSNELDDATITEEINHLSQALNEAHAAQESIEAEWQTLSSKQNELRTQLESLMQQETVSDYSERLEEISHSMNELQTQLETLQNQKSDLNQTLEMLHHNDMTEQTVLPPVNIEDLTKQWEELEAAQAELEKRQAQLDAGFNSYYQGREALQQARQNLATGQDTLASTQRSARTQLNEARSILDSGRSALDAGYQEIEEGEAQLRDAQTRLDQAKQELDAGLNEFQQGLDALFSGYSQLKSGEREWEAGQAFFNHLIEESHYKRRKGQHQIQQGYQNLQEMQEPNLMINDRHGFSAYSSLKDNADQLNVISNFFPVIFLLVAILVAFTTIKRMVSEQRMYMGTMLQLGYPKRSIISKFIVYAGLSSLIGIILGIIIGYWSFPPLIVNAYNNMHYLDNIQISRSHFWNGFVALIALLTALLPAIIQPLRNLQAAPAELLLPEPPRSGQKVFLEHIPFIWNRLSFKKKMTVRNLLRYKGRNAMTLIGVAGCTMLMVAGFGISDTITHMVDVQTQEIQTFDHFVYVNEDADLNSMQNELEQIPDVASTYPVHQVTVETNFDDRDQLAINVMVPLGDPESFHSLIELRTRENRTINLNDGPVMTERLAEHYGYNGYEPTEISIRDDQQEIITVPIVAIAENYLSHYIYMSPEQYTSYFNRDYPEPNLFLIEETKQSDSEQIEDTISELDSVATVLSMTSINQQLNSAMDSLNLITIVLLIAAAGLAFVVLYNLTNINIGERIKELSTIKVLGFYDYEVSLYIYDEILILSVLGGIVGLVLGTILTNVLMKTMQTSDFLFYPVIQWDGYIWSFALTIIFSAIVMFVMHRKLKAIDVVEAMKAVE